jgi:hypothetical protein
MIVLFDNKENVIFYTDFKSGYQVYYQNNKIEKILKDANGYNWYYNSNGDLKYIVQTYTSADKEIQKIAVVNKDGKVEAIVHNNSQTDKRIKEDLFDPESGTLTDEHFFDENGEMLDIT